MTSWGRMGHFSRFSSRGQTLLNAAGKKLLLRFKTAIIMTLMLLGIAHPHPPRV